MKIINETYGFCFEMPDRYSEVKKEEYEEFNTDGSALYVFEAGDDILSFNYSGKVSFFESTIKGNIEAFKGIGVELVERIDEENISILHLEFKPLKLVSMFVKVNGIVLAVAMEVKEFNGEKEVELKTILKSFKSL